MTVANLPAPPPDRLDRSRPGRRWHPTRAGIVNVWRYYDEQFAFHRGRLLLRGPNGSGKSKALELLLPYLLDASQRPSRLSTFGGQERTMHWNLMGDGWAGKSRVGYVWVEFRRARGEDGGDEEWFTIGARLQATVNTRKVDATYFTTSQRVGVPGGLALVGEGDRPLRRADLEAAVGAHGRVHATGADHRRAVMHTLYRGFDDEKYEALVTALLQLRTPKLSEHLDPGELSVQLSRSLPPLDHQAVAEIAEGFEKLDRRREDVAALERDVAAARRLADRQRRYAQRVAREAAAQLVSATSRMDELTRAARESREALGRAETEQGALRASDTRLVEEREFKGVRAGALRHSDAYRAHVTLADWRTQLGELRAQAQQAGGRRDRTDRRLEEDRLAREEAEAATARLGAVVDRAAADAERAAAQAGLPGAFEAAAAADIDRGRGLAGAAVEARERELAEVRQALATHTRAVESRDGAAARLDRRREQHEAAVEARDRRADEHEHELTALRDGLRAWASACAELPVDGIAQALDAAAGDESAVLALVGVAATTLEKTLAAEGAELAGREVWLGAERDARRKERDDLAAREHLVPDAPPSRTAERAGRAGGPLWRLVTFAPGVDAPTQALVEAALADSGLLDAWVLPDGTVRLDEARIAPGGHDRFAEPELSVAAVGSSLLDVLAPEPDVPVPAERIRSLLAAVAYGPRAPAHVAAVGADGSWRLAALTGTWSKTDAEFIGATARDRARRRRLAALDGEIAALDAELAQVRAALRTVEARRERAAEEQARRPSHRALRAAEERLRQAEATVTSRADAVTEAERELADAEQAVTAALRRLAAAASEHRLPTDARGLEEVAQRLRTFRGACDAWFDARRRLEGAKARSRAAAETHERSEEDAAEARRTQEEADRAARKLSIRLQTLEAEVGSDAQLVLAEVEALQTRLRAIDGEREQIARRSTELAEHVGGLAERLRGDEEQRDAAVAVRDAAAEAFRRLGVTGLAEDAGLAVDPATLEGVKATLEAARGVAADLRDAGYEPRQLKEAEGRVRETFHEVSQALAGRADLSIEPDDDGRSVLVASVDGLRLGASALHGRLAAELQAAREELTDDEQELFDRTLAGSARRQVADRIRQATALVDHMNELLGRVQTASKMRVQLRWQVDHELPPGMREARGLILRDPDTLSADDRAALHDFFRARIEEVRAADTATGWEEQLLDVLDYRAWHVFVAQIDRGEGDWQPVTKRTHGQLSGGERAIALHLPLFAAVAAHYAAAEEAPRLILLDEVFVGVDEGNRGQLLDLVVGLDLDAVMTSDHEWCTYTELDGIAVHQLITAVDGDDAVTTARFVWDGYRLQPREPEEVTLPLEGADA